METTLIRPEKQLKALLKVFGFVFLAKACVLFFIPDIAINYVSNLGWTFFNFPVPNAVCDKYFLVLSITFFITLFFTCFMIQANIILRLEMIPILIISNGLMAIGYLVYFVIDHYFIYLLSALLSWIIFILLLYYYQKVCHGRIR